MSKAKKESKKKEKQQINLEEEISNEDKIETNNETTAMIEEKATLNEKKYPKGHKSDVIEVEEIIKEPIDINTYIDLYFCALPLETTYALLYMISSGSLNFIHLLVFFRYNFKFNFSYMFCHQLSLSIFFTILINSKSFKKNTDQISFSDFMTLKWFYFTFSIIYALHYLTSYFAMQLLESSLTFFSLRKLTYLMVCIYQLLVGVKKFSYDKIISLGLIAAGGYLCIIDDLTKLYLGILIVMLSDYISSAYHIYSWSFIKRKGVSNLKILIYNSYILVPGLFVIIFISGEFSDLIKYFNEKGYESIFYINRVEGLFIILGISCFLVVLTMSKYLLNDGQNFSTNVAIINNLNDFLTNGLAYFYIIGFDESVSVIIGFVISIIGNIIGNINEGEEKMPKNVEIGQEVK